MCRQGVMDTYATSRDRPVQFGCGRINMMQTNYKLFCSHMFFLFSFVVLLQCNYLISVFIIMLTNLINLFQLHEEDFI